MRTPIIQHWCIASKFYGGNKYHVWFSKTNLQYLWANRIIRWRYMVTKIWVNNGSGNGSLPDEILFGSPRGQWVKGARQGLTSTVSLDTGIVRRQFPTLRGTTWRNNGTSAWNGFRFEHVCDIYAEITNNWKCLVIIVIKTDLSGFVVPMHSGLCEQYIKPLGLRPPGFDFLFFTRPRALGQQSPPEPVLIP